MDERAPSSLAPLAVDSMPATGQTPSVAGEVISQAELERLGGIRDSALSEALEGVFEQNPNQFGSRALGQIVVSQTKALGVHSTLQRYENKQLTSINVALQNQNSDLRVSLARTEEQLIAAKSSKHKDRIIVAVGTALLGLGYKFWEVQPLSWILIGLGSIMFAQQFFFSDKARGK